jgi:tRNA(fMet)-specific endonuclease VapC
MNRFLLDTGIASDYVNRRAGVFERASESVRSGARLGISSPVLGELWAGVRYSDSPDRNVPRMARQLTDFAVWPFDKAAAEEFGRLYAELRRLGRPMQQIDIQTAAIALTLGNCTVVTKDSDFAAVPGLHVADWSKAASP